MKYVLDTDTLIDCILGTGKTRERLQELIERGDEVALCPVTVAELYSGLSEKRRVKWEGWLLALPYWQVSIKAAMRAGMYRKDRIRDRPDAVSVRFIARSPSV